MLEHMTGYAAFIEERMAEAMSRCPDPVIAIEQQLDLSEYVPEGFGTADCVIIADGLMDVIAEYNPQMEL